MTRVAESEPMIEQAIGMEKMFLMDYKQRLAYIQNIKIMLDEANHDASIERAAKEEERLKIVRNSIRLGIDVEKIALLTGLSKEEILALKE